MACHQGSHQLWIFESTQEISVFGYGLYLETWVPHWTMTHFKSKWRQWDLRLSQYWVCCEPCGCHAPHSIWGLWVQWFLAQSWKLDFLEELWLVTQVQRAKEKTCSPMGKGTTVRLDGLYCAFSHDYKWGWQINIKSGILRIKGRIGKFFSFLKLNLSSGKFKSK